jgi:hypothetical protein
LDKEEKEQAEMKKENAEVKERMERLERLLEQNNGRSNSFTEMVDKNSNERQQERELQ